MSTIDPKDLKEGSFLRQSLQFQMNGDQRVALAVLATERERFAIRDPDPVVIPVPFHVMKEAVAQILTYELEVALGKLPLGVRKVPKLWPQGMRGLHKVAELLMDAAQLEAAGQAIVDENQAPELKPNLKAILGGEE